MHDESDSSFSDDDELTFLSFTDPSGQTQSSGELFARTKSYRCFDDSQIFDHLKEIVCEASELMNVNPDYTELFLREYGWRVDVMVQDWIDAPSRMCKKLRIRYPIPADTNEPVEPTGASSVFTCPILAADYPMSETFALHCGHRFSNQCWRSYLATALEDAQIALNARCPEYQCGGPVSLKAWEMFVSEGNFDRLTKMRKDAFVEKNSRARWCPKPKCGRAVERLQDETQDDPTCDCGYKFCFACGDESHRPVTCSIVERWNKKNQSEAESVSWILVHTKNCPKCKRPIEKGNGCMHMTCHCKAEFCWLCMEDWQAHSSNSYYRCNLFEESTKQMDPSTMERERAKESLERYTHYFERFRAHNHGEVVAQNKQLDHIKACVELLHRNLGELSAVEFLPTAVHQIIECRRILKFSYAFGYFADWTKDPSARHLFEYHQGQLERTLDQLQEKTEKFDPEYYIKPNSNSYGEFFDFKENLVNLTRVVRDFFEKMSKAFETDFFKFA